VVALTVLGGGWSWPSLLVSVIEGVMSVSATVVLSTLFSDAEPGAVTRAVTRTAYGAYLVQTPVLVAIALAVRGQEVAGVVKLTILLPAAVASSFAVAALLRRIPALHQVLR
jgi:peptidoglycan/LPS O-acetylase OafA/YrhL